MLNQRQLEHEVEMPDEFRYLRYDFRDVSVNGALLIVRPRFDRTVSYLLSC